ncbi:uncharacterized protein [Coffea arabica]|uniref:Pescadillo homolog n=1 Tax=Coffea arabica TaxID=13443 RepID=A0ABM4V6Y3_COFAR
MPKHYRPPGKKKEGNAAKYVTRSQAVKYLQVSLSVFRKLCILKGVFPRDPKKKVKGSHHTYYHMKDILFLKHEPLLEKLREMRAYEKKVKKAQSKKNRDLAERLLSRKPSYTLDRLIGERYPKFIDALRDLDDCLSMVHLFAALPAIQRVERENIQVDRIHNCRRLSHEWQAYISRTHKLRKTFISVKGIYYQAEVEGQKVTWLTPHALQQVLPDDVDFKVMLTFLEFYETLLAFVNFKLYHSINVKYPPILDSRLEALAADLYALSRYFDANSKASKLDSEDIGLSGSQQVEEKHEETKLEESELRLAQLQHQLPSNARFINVNIRDMEGMTPLDILRQRPHSVSSDILAKQLISAGGIFSCQDYSTRKAIASHLRMRSIGGSPGTSFRTSDMEIFLYTGIENISDAGGSVGLSPCSTETNHHDSSLETSSTTKRKKLHTVSYAARRLKQLLHWPKMKDKRADRCKKSVGEHSICPSEGPPIPLRQRFSRPSSLPNNKRTLSVRSNLPSPSAKKKLASGLVHGVMQGIPSVNVSRRSRSSSFSKSSFSSHSSLDKQKGIQIENDIAGASCSRQIGDGDGSPSAVPKLGPINKKLMNQLLCFGGPGQSAKAPTSSGLQPYEIYERAVL